MAEYFKCLGCNGVTQVTSSPPTCPRCGCGTGIVTPQMPDPRKENPAPEMKSGQDASCWWRRGKPER